MKNIRYKNLSIIIICLIVIILLILLALLFFDSKNDKYQKIKDSIENVFFYLPEDKYDNMNNISDYCKISLVFDTKYLKSDYKFYDNKGTKINGYTKDAVLDSVRNILGEDATINFNADQSGNYNFLFKDNCIYNSKVTNLTYDNQNNVLYSEDGDNSNRQLVIKWNDTKENNDEVELTAQALMVVQGEDKYDVYIDNNMEYLVGSYKTLKEAKEAARDNYNRSYTYIFKLKKIDDNYIWTEFERVNLDKNIIVE